MQLQPSASAPGDEISRLPHQYLEQQGQFDASNGRISGMRYRTHSKRLVTSITLAGLVLAANAAVVVLSQ